MKLSICTDVMADLAFTDMLDKCVALGVEGIEMTGGGWSKGPHFRADELLADKGLLLSAIITLSLTPWPWKFPLWFPLLVIARDGICIAATFVINFVTGHVEIRPHWTGKVATFLQMVAIGWVLVEWRRPDPLVPTILAGVFTFISGTIYFRDGLRQLRASEHAYPEQPPPPDEREM